MIVVASGNLCGMAVSCGAARCQDVHFAVDVIFLRTNFPRHVRDQFIHALPVPTKDSGQRAHSEGLKPLA